jgi:hypothetical protein
MKRFLPPPPRKSEKKINCRLIDPHDLGALEAKASHQTLLIEREGVDVAVQGVGGEGCEPSLCPR